MKKLVLLLLFVTLLLPGCRGKDTTDMTGVLYSLTDTTILVVEGIESADIPYEEWFEQGLPALSFATNEKTDIIGLDGSKTSFIALQKGQTVTVSYSGPVLTSYPGQAGADRVVIVADPPDPSNNGSPDDLEDPDETDVSPEEPPVHDITDERELYEFIIPAEYTKWTKAPGYETRQPAAGPHRSEVDIYMNDIAKEALLSGNISTLPPASLIVKDAFLNGNLNEIAAMYKLSDGRWFWAEWRGDGSHILSGIDHRVCINCHTSENDGVLAFPLAP